MPNATLSDEQKRFCERFERFAQERIAPRAQEVDRTCAVPEQSWNELREFGYFRLFHAKDIGGLGASPAVQVRVLESLAKACGSTYLYATVSSILAGKMMAITVTKSQQERFLTPLVTGAKVGCVGVAETGSNHDPSNWTTTVRKAGANWLVNGAKVRVTNAASADLCLLVARYEPSSDADQERGLRFVLLDLHRRGISRFRLPVMGLTASSWGGIICDDVEVPAEEVCAVDFAKVVEFTEWGQLAMAFGAIGMAEAALDACVEFSASRNSFGQPLGQLQSMSRMLASMRASINGARELTRRTFYAKLAGEAVTELAPLAKITATEMSVQVTKTAMLLQGGWASAKTFVAERLYRDCMTNVAGGAANDQLRDRIGMKAVDVNPQAPPPALDWLAYNGLQVTDLGAAVNPGPTPHTRMYADRRATAFEWSASDKSLLAQMFCGQRSLRNVSISDAIWARLGTIADTMGTDRESLLNQAIHDFVRHNADFPNL